MKRLLRVAGLMVCMPAASAQIYCDPCSNGDTPSQDSSCSGLVSQAQKTVARTAECANIQLELYQNGCCNGTPRERCTLCPDGQAFDGSAMVPNFKPHDTDIACADLNADPTFLGYLFESGKCADTLLRRSAAWCKCPGVERQCSLCPNGERPPNPGLIDPVYYGWDCDTFDYMSSYFSQSECGYLVNSILEFDAPSYCGCTDSPIPNVCDLCPPGQMLAHPNLMLGQNKRFSCRELALSTLYIPSEGPCTRVLNTHQANGYVRACCAPIDMVPKKFGGTAAGPKVNGCWRSMALATLLAFSLVLLLGGL